MNVSRNQVQGSLADTPLDKILAACKRHLITGVIKVTDGHKRVGRIELRAGVIDRAELDGHSDATTVVKLEQFAGDYELEQQLPDLTGALGGAALAEGDVSGVPFVALMRHCEDHALTCTITVTREGETIELEYRAGEIKKITRNGEVDEDAIVDATRWTNARFRVTAPPLDMEVEGWPVVRPQTEPFTLDDAAKAARADSAQPVAPVVAKAEPEPEPVVAKEQPKPEPKPEPVVAKPEPKPEPVVAEEEPKPEPTPEPKPIVEEKKVEPKKPEEKKLDEPKPEARSPKPEKKSPAEVRAEKKKKARERAESKPPPDDKVDEKHVETVKIDRPAKKEEKPKPKPAPEPAKQPAKAKDRAVTAGSDRDLLWMVIAFVVLAAALGAVAFLL